MLVCLEDYVSSNDNESPIKQRRNSNVKGNIVLLTYKIQGNTKTEYALQCYSQSPSSSRILISSVI